ncbi:MAG: aspartate dehydrogenase, partial [Rhodosalinus sp.]
MHLGLIGYGTIAATLAQLLAEHGPRAERITVLTRAGREDAARDVLAGHAVEVVTDAPAVIAARPDIVVECAGHGAVSAHVAPVLAAGLDVALASVVALADAGLHDALLSAAADGGARLILPAGAVGGTDLLAALAPAGGLEVTYTGTKPPAAWKGTPAEPLLDLDAL